MAIARDNSATFVSPASGANSSFTTAGANLYLFVCVLDQNSSTSALTYGGVAMTQILSLSTTNVSTGETLYFYGLANPATGANNLVVTYTGSNTVILDASSYTGAQQTTTLEASGSATGASGTATKTIATITDNDWLVGYARAQSAITAGSNTSIVTSNSSRDFIDSNAVQTPPGSVAMSFTTASNNNWGIIVAALKVVAPASGGTLTLMGV